MSKKYLLLDCDGVIFNSNVLIDKEVQKIEFKASDKYCEMLNNMETECINQLHSLEIERAITPEKKAKIKSTIDEIKRLRKEHFLFKDMVLEEVLPKYVGLINYDNIYQMHRTFTDVIEKIREISLTGVFEDIYIVSHYNSSREGNAKVHFFKKYLPMVKVVLVKFHKDKFILGDDAKNCSRARTNKLLDFSDQTGITDFSQCSFIDDTPSIIAEAQELGMGHCEHKGKRITTVSLLENAFKAAICDFGKLNNDGIDSTESGIHKKRKGTE